MYKPLIPALAVAAVLALAGCQSSSGGSSPSTSTPAGSTPTAAAAAPQSQQPAPPAAPAKLLEKAGSGITTTEQFTTGGPWTLDWSYDCAAFGGSGNFIVTVDKDSGDQFTADAGVNQLGPKGQGTEHFYDKGTFHLEVNSECSWTVTVNG